MSSFDRDRSSSTSHDDTELGGPSPGKRSRSESLPVQRRSVAASDGAAAPTMVSSDDVFGLHLDPVQRQADGAAPEAAPAEGEGAVPEGPKQLLKAKPRQKPEGGIVGDDVGGAAAVAPGAAAPGAAAPGAAAPGAVQRRADGGADASSVQAAAAQGIAGASTSMPHQEAIQAAFGHHDIGSIAAHTDGAAASANQSMQAEAYATGSHVAFASSAPSLHTAAHEAAHVVQQRAGVHLKGGVGEVGDGYERHADAVADRVVQGKSAVDLLDQFASGSSNHDAIQRKDAPAAPASGSEATAGPAATKSHYEVELKAWIPHAKVVDPEEPVRASDWLDTISSVASALSPPGLRAQLKYEYHSFYRGDGHSGYGGGYRVLSKASFDWDGHTISAFRQTGLYGASHRDYNYRAWLDLSVGVGSFSKSLGSLDVASGSNTETDTASAATSGASASGNSFTLGMASANPLVMTWAPDIDSQLTGHVDAAGNVAVDYHTDLFPSHGFQVKKDGAVVKSQIVNDASGVNGLGPLGAIEIGRRLTSFSNVGAA